MQDKDPKVTFTSVLGHLEQLNKIMKSKRSFAARFPNAFFVQTYFLQRKLTFNSKSTEQVKFSQLDLCHRLREKKTHMCVDAKGSLLS